MQRYLRLAGWLVLVTLANGCGQSGPAGPGPVTSATLSGTWSGRVSDSYAGVGRLRLTIEQEQFGLSGTFSMEFDDPARDRAGTLSGNIEQPTLPPRMQLASSGGFGCPPGAQADSFLLLTWMQAGERLTGTYAGFGCAGMLTGTFDVTRH